MIIQSTRAPSPSMIGFKSLADQPTSQQVIGKSNPNQLPPVPFNSKHHNTSTLQRQMSTQSDLRVKLIWKDLTYTVPNSEKSSKRTLCCSPSSSQLENSAGESASTSCTIKGCLNRSGSKSFDESTGSELPFSDSSSITSTSTSNNLSNASELDTSAKSPPGSNNEKPPFNIAINSDNISNSSNELGNSSTIGGDSINGDFETSPSSDIKVILKTQSGHITGGTITALMGPSGAGKSTLLNCITNKITQGVAGDIWIRLPVASKLLKPTISRQSSTKSSQTKPYYSGNSYIIPMTDSSSDVYNIRIAFVPQNDHLFTQFTIRESLLFASRLNNSAYSYEDHVVKVNDVLRGLDLERCADLRISSLSGGQVKRTSIAVELISNPTIVILDEPTSGLDSDNSENVIRLLKGLTESTKSHDAPAIITTIHQPSYEVFNMFNMVYLLDKFGENIYFGSPEQLVPYLCSFGFKEPSNVNPADYAIEISNGRFGTKSFEPMIEATKLNFEQQLSIEASNGSLISPNCQLIPIGELKSTISTSYFFQFWLIFTRMLQAYLFKSPMTLVKAIMNVIVAALVCAMWTDPIGTEDGCWSASLNYTNTSSEADALKNSILSAATSETTREEYVGRITRITNNINFIFMSGLYLMLVYTVSTVLLIPLEIRTVTKEVSNRWYRVSSYFTAKTTCDLFLMLLTLTVSIVYKYTLSYQIPVLWRFSMYFIITFTFSQVCESLGTLIGIIFSWDQIVATIIACTTIFPVVIFSGFLVKINSIPWYFKPMTYCSHLKYAFEGMLLSIYGFSRCTGGEVVKDFIDDITATSRNPMSLISTIWSSLEISPRDTRRFAILLGLEENQLAPVITAISEYLGTDHKGAPSSDLDTSDSATEDYLGVTDAEPGTDEATNSVYSSGPEHPSKYEPSYVLSYFGLHDNNLFVCIGVLILMIFVLRTASFIALIRKTKGQRL